MGLNTTNVIRGNAENHRLTIKGSGAREVSINELKTKRDKVAALMNRDRSRIWSSAAVSKHFGWNGAGYADNVWAKLYEQRYSVYLVAPPSTGGKGVTPTSAFWVEKWKSQASPQLLHL